MGSVISEQLANRPVTPVGARTYNFLHKPDIGMIFQVGKIYCIRTVKTWVREVKLRHQSEELAPMAHLSLFPVVKQQTAGRFGAKGHP